MNPRLCTAFPFYGALCALLFVVVAQAAQFDMAQSNNVAIYWGQNDSEPDLMDVCQSDASDTVILAFVSAYPTSTGSMEYGFGACNQDDLNECAQLEDAVKACQAAGKIVTVSIGGGDGSVVLSSDDDAEKFGEMVYDTFLGGKGQNRPFGDVVLDGVDLDIEGGDTTHFPAFVNRMWEYAKEQGDHSRKYYLTGAPQCPFPDGYMSYVLSRVPFDAVYIQFYNNEPTCGLEVAQRGWDNFNFATWDDWAANTSPNKNIRLYIGSPASQAAGSYYVDAAQMGTIIAATRQNYSSFGGVMLWDAGNARDNGNFDKQMKNFLMEGGDAPLSGSSTSAASADTLTSTWSGASSTTSNRDDGQSTSTSDSNATTSRRRHKTTSGFETSRASATATATADNTCHTPAGNSGEDGDP